MPETGKAPRTMDRSGVAQEEPEAFIPVSEAARSAFLGLFSRLSAQPPPSAIARQPETKRDWRHIEFFDFLQLSPSYEVARSIISGEVDVEAQPVPRDIDIILRVHNRLGDVNNIVFAEWYEDRLLPALATQGTPYVSSKRRRVAKDRGQTDQTDVGRATEPSDRLLDLKPGRVQHHTVSQARRLIMEQVGAPHLRLFVLGKRIGIAPVHDTDEQAARRDVQGRDMMDIMTSQRLLRAYRFAEHAARGRFPCLDPLPTDPGRPIFSAMVMRANSVKHFNTVSDHVERYWQTLPTWAQTTCEE